MTKKIVFTKNGKRLKLNQSHPSKSSTTPNPAGKLHDLTTNSTALQLNLSNSSNLISSTANSTTLGKYARSFPQLKHFQHKQN